VRPYSSKKSLIYKMQIYNLEILCLIERISSTKIQYI
jgi:hypothetical protein